MRPAKQRHRFAIAAALAACAIFLTYSHATSFASAESGGGAGHGLDPSVLIGVALMLVVAKLCGEVFERLGQPAVLGELVGGIVVGNLALAGLGAFEPLEANAIISALAEIGVVILLFEVGLESNLGEMIAVGRSALLVAVLGVAAPFLLGWGVAAYFLPEASRLTHVFLGATLCATSVGITARVLRDMGKLDTRVARVILGAAVIDDVLGLIVLAVVQGAVFAANAGAGLSAAGVVVIATKAVGFVVAALVAGKLLVPYLFRGAARLEGRGVLLALAVSVCFALAWAADAVGLAPIVGAFAAGLLLEEAHFEHLPDQTKHDLSELLTPISQLLVPIFFVFVGLRVDLRVFARLDLLAFAAVLTAAAVAGKQVCALGVVERGVSRLAVGLGMIPRGEVGLIFAGIGASLMLPGAGGRMEPVVGPTAYGAIIFMVVFTTLVTPPALKWALSRRGGGDSDSHETLAPPARGFAGDAAERTTR